METRRVDEDDDPGGGPQRIGLDVEQLQADMEHPDVTG
jgi:hypothetical protein